MTDKTKEEPYIPVMYHGKPAKMLNIFFGEVLLELETGERILVQETLLDQNWRRSGEIK